jgi:hypothetical protein
VAGFYSAARDRVMPPLRGLLLHRRVHSGILLTYFARREAHLIADAPHAFAAAGIPGVGEVAAGIGVIGGAVLSGCKQT